MQNYFAFISIDIHTRFIVYKHKINKIVQQQIYCKILKYFIIYFKFVNKIDNFATQKLQILLYSQY